MEREEIRETFEAFFDKFKKTEGDESLWAAVWFTMGPAGKFEINLSKCPDGTNFNVFLNNKRLAKISGWDRFFEEIEEVARDHPGAYDPDEFFESMKEMT